MNRYKCDHCGREFEEPDFVEETHGLENPPYEKIAVCPYCKGYFEEVYECKICGAFSTYEQLTLGVCDDCLMAKATVERCLKFGDDCEENVPINGFVASLLSPRKINEILIKTISDANSIIPIDCFNFVLNDDAWFAEKVIEEEKENF
jgi:DNA-directed RNA polymerase subunit RPC12/RpoP